MSSQQSLTTRINLTLCGTDYRIVHTVRPLGPYKWEVYRYSPKMMRRVRGFTTRLAAVLWLLDTGRALLPRELVAEAASESP